MIIFASILTFIGSLFTASLVLVVTNKGHYLSHEFDRLCDDIRKCAELGVDYWHSNEQYPETSKMTARIIGYQELINLSIVSLSKHLDNNRRKEFLDAQKPFIRSLSGDTFSEGAHVAEPERAFLIQYEMSKLINEVKKYQVSTMAWKNLFANIFKLY